MGMVLVEDKGHVKVESLTPGGNAELSGLVKPGDIVVRYSTVLFLVLNHTATFNLNSNIALLVFAGAVQLF